MSDSRVVLSRDAGQWLTRLVLAVLALISGIVIGTGTVPGRGGQGAHGPTPFTTNSVRGAK